MNKEYFKNATNGDLLAELNMADYAYKMSGSPEPRNFYYKVEDELIKRKVLDKHGQIKPKYLRGK